MIFQLEEVANWPPPPKGIFEDEDPESEPSASEGTVAKNAQEGRAREKGTAVQGEQPASEVN